MLHRMSQATSRHADDIVANDRCLSDRQYGTIYQELFDPKEKITKDRLPKLRHNDRL